MLIGHHRIDQGLLTHTPIRIHSYTQRRPPASGPGSSRPMGSGSFGNTSLPASIPRPGRSRRPICGSWNRMQMRPVQQWLVGGPSLRGRPWSGPAPRASWPRPGGSACARGSRSRGKRRRRRSKRCFLTWWSRSGCPRRPLGRGAGCGTAPTRWAPRGWRRTVVRVLCGLVDRRGVVVRPTVHYDVGGVRWFGHPTTHIQHIHTHSRPPRDRLRLSRPPRGGRGRAAAGHADGDGGRGRCTDGGGQGEGQERMAAPGL